MQPQELVEMRLLGSITDDVDCTSSFSSLFDVFLLVLGSRPCGFVESGSIVTFVFFFTRKAHVFYDIFYAKSTIIKFGARNSHLNLDTHQLVTEKHSF